VCGIAGALCKVTGPEHWVPEVLVYCGNNGGRFTFFNQSLIDPDPLFDRDRDRDENFSIKVRLNFFNQSLLKKIQSASGCKKLNTCT
jgi:hypothetical protein